MQQAALLTPFLREDLRLLKGPAGEDGSPGWLLYDPLRNSYFTLGFMAFRLFKHWRGGEELARVLERAWAAGLDVTEQELTGFLHFLTASGLTIARGPEAARRLAHEQARSRQHWLTWLIHHYLSIRIPLLRPDPWLERALPRVAPLASRRLRRAIQVLGAIGILLALRQWEQFTTTFLHFFSWEGFAFYGITLIFIKAAHELGHAFAAKRRGCRVASMGIAFLVLFPFLYTDTTDAWRLRSRRDRLSIVLAGVVTELHLALLATFFWSFLPDGPARSAAFFIATASWITSLAINMSPFMRFDGYYALSDWLRAENLQPRSFAMGRWQLREWLFGFGEPPPEPLPEGRRRTFVLYAWATWIYRFSLFLGIALLVYHFAFKVLGIVLFAVEIGWFILLPVRREMQEWWKRKAGLSWNRRRFMTFLLLAGMLLLAAVPWRPTLPLPAVLEAERFAHLFSPEPAQVTEVRALAGNEVAEGDILVVLGSPVLVHEAELVRRRMALVRTRLNRRGGSQEDLDSLLVLQGELAKQERALAGLESRMERLVLRAPFAGRISRVADLRPGQWVSRTEALAAIVAPGGWRVSGLAAEEDLPRIARGAAAVFIPPGGQGDKVVLQLVSLDEAAVAALPWPALASLYGGPVAVRPLDGNGGRLRPEQALYRVVLEPMEPVAPPAWQLPGIVHVEGTPRSWLGEVGRQFAAVLVRESGF